MNYCTVHGGFIPTTAMGGCPGCYTQVQLGATPMSASTYLHPECNPCKKCDWCKGALDSALRTAERDAARAEIASKHERYAKEIWDVWSDKYDAAVARAEQQRAWKEAARERADAAVALADRLAEALKQTADDLWIVEGGPESEIGSGARCHSCMHHILYSTHEYHRDDCPVGRAIVTAKAILAEWEAQRR